jgi:predicted phosphatase
MSLRRVAAPPIALLVLDGDHTLWQPLDVLCCSERASDDAVGWPGCAFAPAPADPDLAIREDGVRFRLAPGARAVLERAHAAGIRLALASYNHGAPVRGLLAAFGLLPLFSQVVGVWSSDKAAMLQTILAAEAAAGRPTSPNAVLFVDDDPQGLYRPMMARLGIRFAQMGHPAEAPDFAAVARLIGVALA